MPTKNGSKAKSKTVAEVMTPDPIALLETESLEAAGRAMRDNDIGDVIVLDDTGGRFKGLVTDRDIVVRAVADGEDPARTTLSAICTAKKVYTVEPNDSIDKAVKLMSDHAIRRLPVVENEKPVGFLSIGDLAQELDKESALASISAAPAND